MIFGHYKHRGYKKEMPVHISSDETDENSDDTDIYIENVRLSVQSFVPVP